MREAKLIDGVMGEWFACANCGEEELDDHGWTVDKETGELVEDSEGREVKTICLECFVTKERRVV